MNDRQVLVDGGSYRDPSGFVFRHSQEIYRCLDEHQQTIIDKMSETGILDRLIQQGLLVGTRTVEEDGSTYKELRSLLPDWHHFLEHEKIEHISYPYEWPVSMLAAAAQLHLQLQQELLAEGLSLKDATAFNVQFQGTTPVFIDVSSVEQPTRKDIWIAYGQFCRMFLYPLALHLYKGLTFQQTFLADLEGLEVEQAHRLLGTWGCLRHGLFLDLFLQSVLNKKGNQESERLQSELQKDVGRAETQILNLKRLAGKITKLQNAWTPSGHWATYDRENSYSTESQSEKGRFIERFMKAHAPSSILDLGCNTGTYSIMAARAGADVVAIDSDHDCIEILYRTAKKDSLSILPLVVNLANPSPGLGHANRERRSFYKRFQCEGVFALALFHHLLITARLPMSEIRDMMAGFTTKYLVIEFVEPGDSMFRKLLALREDIYGDITLDRFTAVFEETFDVIEQHAIEDTQRHLFVLRKKA